MTGKVVHNCKTSTIQAVAGGWQVPGQLGLHSETLFQKKTNRERKKRKSTI
jgi:hypothetical protein